MKWSRCVVGIIFVAFLETYNLVRLVVLPSCLSVAVFVYKAPSTGVQHALIVNFYYHITFLFVLRFSRCYLHSFIELLIRMLIDSVISRAWCAETSGARCLFNGGGIIIIQNTAVGVCSSRECAERGWRKAPVMARWWSGRARASQALARHAPLRLLSRLVYKIIKLSCCLLHAIDIFKLILMITSNNQNLCCFRLLRIYIINKSSISVALKQTEAMGIGLSWCPNIIEGACVRKAWMKNISVIDV